MWLQQTAGDSGAKLFCLAICIGHTSLRLSDDVGQQIIQDPANDKLPVNRDHGIRLVRADRQAAVIDRPAAEDDGGFVVHDVTRENK